MFYQREFKEYIDPVKKPVLAAGNSESDIEMLNYSENNPGMKILVTQDEDYKLLLMEKIFQ